ncbi:hypothetical protein CGQ24_13835 [Arthrobacter sp. 7749]|nr:hypothetical protein CGQ24_13835 [Arthrobacter sp. 7749]
MRQSTGATWWKVDFHAHSPASFDFGGPGEGKAGPDKIGVEEWLKAYMAAEIDVVVITDHNSSAGIELARQALQLLRESNDANFRELILLAGIEITVASGTHLLGVFDADTDPTVISDLLVNAAYTGTRGESTKAATKSLSEVANFIHLSGGLAIPAHVHDAAGLFHQTGTGWNEVLDEAPIAALESSKPYASGSRAATSKLVRVLGSDAHHLNGDGCPPGLDPKFPGSHYTWIKMSLPNLDGIRNALTDGVASVIPSDEAGSDPRIVSHAWIQSMQFGETVLNFSPWMNSVIGGRGVGKSTAIETLRLALDRHHELPPSLKSGLSWFSPEPANKKDEKRIWDSDFTASTSYTKDGIDFRIGWSQKDGHTIEERGQSTWEDSPGHVKSRFPARIYSQKQIYEMAVDPQALLRIVDSAPEIKIEDWRQEHLILCDEYRALVAEKQALHEKISGESRINGEILDLTRNIQRAEALESSNELKTLRNLETSKTQYDSWLADVRSAATQLLTNQEELTWPQPPQHEGVGDDVKDRIQTSQDVVSEVKGILAEALLKLQQEVASLVAAETSWGLADKILETKTAILNTAPDGSNDANGSLHDLPEWKLQLAGLIRKQAELADHKTKFSKLDESIQTKIEDIFDSRSELTTRRRAVLSDAIQRVDNVRVNLREQGYEGSLESEWRSLLQKDSGFDAYFTNDSLFSGLGNPRNPNYVKTDLPNLRDRFTQIAERGTNAPWLQKSKIDGRLITHIESLSPTQRAEFQIWFPEDMVEVEFKSPGNDNYKPIAEGSPGQKTAALLALVLSMGDEPLVLDQPEDDLDNKLIYSLVVAMLRKIKTQRQVIVVTHNANIVVNGNSESVSVLDPSFPAGTAPSGSLAEKEVRDAVCAIMEGGEEAIRKRFKRLQLR